jgi:hypothetical protein
MSLVAGYVQREGTPLWMLAIYYRVLLLFDFGTIYLRCYSFLSKKAFRGVYLCLFEIFVHFSGVWHHHFPYQSIAVAIPRLNKIRFLSHPVYCRGGPNANLV